METTTYGAGTKERGIPSISPFAGILRFHTELLARGLQGRSLRDVDLLPVRYQHGHAKGRAPRAPPRVVRWMEEEEGVRRSEEPGQQEGGY